MTCGRGKDRSCALFAGNEKFAPTKTFSYLGIILEELGSWGPAIRSRTLSFKRAMAALMIFARKMGKRPPEILLKIYQAKCISTAIYGAGVWGACDSSSIQKVENAFLRFFLAIPQCTPVFNCHSELGIGHVSDLISMQPILL